MSKDADKLVYAYHYAKTAVEKDIAAREYRLLSVFDNGSILYDCKPIANHKFLSAIELLKEISLEHDRKKRPSIPEHCRAVHRFNDKTANGLTKCVITFLNLSGHRADRISAAGRYIEGEKITDVIGFTRQMKGSFIPGTTRKGYADINASIKIPSQKFATPLMIEIKMKDKQSEVQKKFQAAEERAGGFYSIVHSFEEFYLKYLEMMKL